VRLDPTRNTAVVYKNGVTPEKEWEIASAYSVAFLSNDGRFLVAVYPGGNLLAIDHAPDEVMLTFIDQGTLVARIRLNELIEHKQLTRTASHYVWASSFGFQSDHRFRVETADHRVHVFDVTTGQPVIGDRKKRAPTGR
jgi:hypothetical protein